MRHHHQRGRMIASNERWCKACVAEGNTSYEEMFYEPSRRGKVKPGMTVSWSQFMGQDGAGNDLWVPMTGQVWAATDQEMWSSIIQWWVVTSDQKVWRVRQDDMRIDSKGIADACLV